MYGVQCPVGTFVSIAEVKRKLVCVRCEYRTDAFGYGARCPEHEDVVLIDQDVCVRYLREPLLGRVLAGKYALVDIVGGGGMGAVYRAVRLPIGGEVAVKVIRPEQGKKIDVLRARFFYEARSMARLNDPSVVVMLDYGEEPDGLLYMVLELVRGCTLKSVLRAEKRLMPLRAVTIACHVLDALEEAHNLGLVHRDIKPANIMLSPRRDGRDTIKLLDFGIAKQVEESEEYDSGGLTATGVVVGTPRYIAPEQVRNEDFGPRADIYSLGVVLYQMLTGQPPFGGRNQYDLMTAHVRSPVPPMPRDSQVPEPIEATIRRALEKDPAARFETAGEMREALITAVVEAYPEGLGISGEASISGGLSISSLGLAVPGGSLRGNTGSAAAVPARDAVGPTVDPSVEPYPPEDATTPSLPGTLGYEPASEPDEDASLAPQPVPMWRSPLAVIGLLIAIVVAIAWGAGLFGLFGSAPVPPSPGLRAAPPPVSPVPTPARVTPLVPKPPPQPVVAPPNDAGTPVEPPVPDAAKAAPEKKADPDAAPPPPAAPRPPARARVRTPRKARSGSPGRPAPAKPADAVPSWAVPLPASGSTSGSSDQKGEDVPVWMLAPESRGEK